MQPGDIYRHSAFYLSDTGEVKAKYFLVLAVPRKADIVVRLLTSRPHGRPETPPCYHGQPYGGYFLGVIGAPLMRKSWVDLRYADDLDPIDVRADQTRSVISHITTLPSGVLRAVKRHACATRWLN